MKRLIYALAFLLALSIGRVDAAVYTVVQNATVTYTTFAACAGVCFAVPISAGTTGGPASAVTYEVITGPGTACSAQPIGSNDKVNWVAQGSVIAVAAGAGSGAAAITATWAYWSATITTLTGTGATCTVTVSG